MALTCGLDGSTAEEMIQQINNNEEEINKKVNKSGDIMTGTLTVNSTGRTLSIMNPTYPDMYTYIQPFVDRFRFVLSNPAGGERELFTINNTTGVVHASLGNFSTTAVAPTAVNHLTRKDYVDNQIALLSNLLVEKGLVTQEEIDLLYNVEPLPEVD